MKFPNETLLGISVSGLTPTELLTIEQFNFTRLTDFPIAKYRQYVGRLLEYRWQPLIIAELLPSGDQILWIDAHVRLDQQPNPNDFDGIRMFIGSTMNLFAAKNPLMGDFLPVGNLSDRYDTQMFGSGLIAILR